MNKTINFTYKTELRFSSPASDHRFSLKILPQDDSRQRIIDLAWEVLPMERDGTGGKVWRTADGFGNAVLSGFIDEPHDYFSFGIEGTAEISDEPFVAPITNAGERSSPLLYPSALTQPVEPLAAIYNDIKTGAPADTARCVPTVERALYFAHAVHERMRYERGITSPSTTASEAYRGGVGVCQDFAHILLAWLRLDGIPCRYVAGLASDYGETHAWVEAWLESESKYCGIDPTRDKLVDEGYVALSRGRDFNDCNVDRGTYKGACKGVQTIMLTMEAAQ